MPILEVELVLRPNEKMASNLAADIADHASVVFGAPPGHTWVRLHTLSREQYAEDHNGPPPEVFPVFVTILHLYRPSGDRLADEVKELTVAIAAVCDRPAANVHLFYQPDGAGRVAFGGRFAS